MWLGVFHNFGLTGLALWDLLGTSEWHFFFSSETLSTSARQILLTYFLVSYNYGRFNFFGHVPVCTFGNKKRWCWCGRELSVGSCDSMGLFNVFDDFFKKSWIFFETSFATTIFVSSQVFLDCCFLMLLRTSVFLRLLFLRSSTMDELW